ncbi:MAG: GNAT family N-acetyltransferase [Alkalilacustris sp.]
MSAPQAAALHRQRLRAAPEAVLAEILALNEAVEERTAPLDPARLSSLIARASFAEARLDETGRVAGFLLGFDHDVPHDSPNFRWFTEHSDAFAYVDRVVVAPWAQGRGVARALYADYAAQARARGLQRMTCEVNRVPPNPESDAFHAALVFEELAQAIPLPGKMVRYLSRPLAGWPKA